MEAFNIRKAQEPDFPGILDLITAFSIFQRTPEKVTVTLEQMKIDKDLFQCYIAEVNNEIVGFASFYFAYYSWSGKALYLDDLYVKDAFRKSGIGKKLLETVINLAKAEQCKKVRWQVSKWNHNAIEFYKKMGAVIDDVEINCDFIIQK